METIYDNKRFPNDGCAMGDYISSIAGCEIVLFFGFFFLGGGITMFLI